MSAKVQQKKIQKKVHKGFFISNERKKNPGGRIKCQEFQNKIQVMGKNQSIHESEVEWVEVRRYKKVNRDKKHGKQQSSKSRNQKGKEKTEQEIKNGSKKVEQIKKVEPKIAQKYKEKGTSQSQVSQNKNKKKYKKRQQQIVSKNEQQIQKQELKDLQKNIQSLNIQEQEITYIENNRQQVKKVTVKEQQAEQKQQSQDIKQQQQNDKEREDKERGNESESEEEEEEKEKDLQIIVGKIINQISIPFKTKPFVGILYFSKKNRKYKQKEDQKKQSPIEQIFNDFYADIHPIHARLPVMELDDYILQNNQILMDYVNKQLKFNEKAPRKAELNRIIDELSSVYIFITFSQWDGEKPLAKLHKILGKAMTIEGQCERFLYEHGLNGYEYEKEEQKVIPINPSKFHKRVDRMVFTIDPPTSTDLDDALSIQKLQDNHFLVGIHIADVTSYLHLLDREQLARRTTSVYLPYKVYHMLSRNFVKVCSLDPGVDRLAFTVWVNFDSEGNVFGESRIQKSIIQSRFKLSYEVVQNITTGNLQYEQFNKKYPSRADQFEELLQCLLDLTEIANSHRSKRVIFDVFENKQLQFVRDESGWPIQCFVDKRFSAKKMIQEFMIIGNIQSAKIICKANPESALIIHHPKPSKLSVTFFNEMFKEFQIKLKFQSSLETQRNLFQIEQNPKIKQQIKKICYFKARRSMEAANYKIYKEIIDEQTKLTQKMTEKEIQKALKSNKESQQFPIIHFALGLQFYTHFTSPMRRMADIVVHETLNQIIQGKKEIKIDTSEIQKINNGRKYTKRLKKDLNEIYLCLMIYHTKKPMECEGIIASFGMMSVSIYIPMFDMQKEVLWKGQFDIHSIKRIRNQEDKLDVKLYHDKKTSKKDVYWVIQRFQTVMLKLQCTKYAPLKLKIEMTVKSEKGEWPIKWVQEA